MDNLDIGIVGAGYVGGTLARKLAAVGHRVRIANSKDPSTLTEYESEEGITAMWASEAIDGVDIAILSVPQIAITKFSDSLKSLLSSVPIVIDTGNYYPVRDGRIAALDDGLPDSEWVASLLGRPVFKAFNNMTAPSLKHKGTTEKEGRLALAVAGPATDDKQKVFSLVDQLGFDPIDGGELAQSWRQQPGTPVYCQDLDAEDMRAGLLETDRSKFAEYCENRDSVKDFDAAMKTMGQYM